MRLHEEYILRNKLNVPIVRYDSRSSVTLRTKSTPIRWSTFSIEWHDQDRRPGYFHFSMMEPIYDGHGSFRQPEKDYCVHWEQYESEVLKIVEYYKSRGFSAKCENRMMMSWEMFLFMYDSWFAANMPSEFYQHVLTSTKPTTDLHHRVNAVYKACNMISQADTPESKRINETLKYNILSVKKQQSKWLENLLNE